MDVDAESGSMFLEFPKIKISIDLYYLVQTFLELTHFADK